MFRRLVLAGIAMVAASVVSVAEAQEKLVVISTQEIDLAQERATIDLTKAKGAYRAVRIRTKTGAADMTRVQVLYANGAVHNEDRVIHLLPGERSRAIDPRNEDRFLDQINITYKPIAGRKEKKATIEVIGAQSRAGARAVRPSTPRPTPPVAADPSTSNIVTTPTSQEPSTTTPGTATAGGDVLFGAQNVGFGVDRDVIRVGNEIGKFNRIRMRILENDVFINELKVVYSNDEVDALVVNANIKANSRTEWFNLKGDRFIKEIQMSYRSRPSLKGQARVEVFGEYADGWLGPNGEGRKYNQGWVLLGAQTAGFVGFDKDIIQIGKNEGGFKKIRVTVKDRAITLNELRVLYLNGADDIIPVRTKVDAGSTYGPIDLKGGIRAIKEIQAKYRSRFFDRSAAGKGMGIVEVWGQH